MIKEVIQGEKLTAKTQNEIIQACNGLMQPAGSYVNTPNGSLYPNAAPSFNNMLGRCVETVFQLKFGLKQVLCARSTDEDRQTLSDDYERSAVAYGYSMDLGNDFFRLKTLVSEDVEDIDDIFIVGKDIQSGDPLSVHFSGSQQLIDGSDKEGFFDLGIYWKTPSNGCPAVEAQVLTLSAEYIQQSPKTAFVIRGTNYPSLDTVAQHYAQKYGGEWREASEKHTTIGYVYNQKLVQLKLGTAGLFKGGDSTEVDSKVPAVHLSSIQTGSYDDGQYHQLFNFNQSHIGDFALSDQNYCDIVIRDYDRDRVPVGAAVNYVKIHDFLSATRYDSDTVATQNDQRSVEIQPAGGDIKRDYIQLYDFDDPLQNEFLHSRLTYGQNSYVVRPGNDSSQGDSTVQFLVRDSSSNDTMLVYDGIKLSLPKPNAYSDIDNLSDVISSIVIQIDPGHECSCNISALSSAIDDLSSELSDRWKCGGTYDDNCYGQSIGDNSMRLAIDIDNGQIWYEGSMTLDWHACQLYDQNGADGPGNLMVDWGDGLAYDKNQVQAIDWDGRMLKDVGGMPTVEWDSKLLNGDYGTAVDWQNHMLMPTGGSPTVEWGNCVLNDLQGSTRLDWNTRELIGDWSCPYGDFAIDGGFVLKIGNTSLSEAQLSALLALI